MTQVTDPTTPTAVSETDLAAEVQRVLEGSPEPLTLSKIRAALPTRLRSVSLETLAEVLRRQVAANVLVSYPKYRSQQDRFWDRPMPVHLAQLLRQALEEGPLAWSELRRKLPDYAKTQAESVLEERVVQGLLYRHPPASSRGGVRFGLQRPDPKEYLRAELTGVFERLQRLGFSQVQLREGALDLLHEEEWASPLAQTAEPAGTTAGTSEPRPQGAAALDAEQPVGVTSHAAHEPPPAGFAQPHHAGRNARRRAPELKRQSARQLSGRERCATTR
jgi:hypothetical protein